MAWASSGFSLACVAGPLSAVLVARLSLSMIGFGVPGGATIPVQELAVKPGTPFSAMVGTSGRASSRFGDGVPSGRNFPSRSCGSRIEQVSTARSIAGAEEVYPSRPIRLIIPFPPGGPTDVMGRLISAALSDQLGQQVYALGL